MYLFWEKLRGKWRKLGIFLPNKRNFYLVCGIWKKNAFKSLGNILFRET